MPLQHPLSVVCRPAPTGPTPDDATVVVFRRRLGAERFQRLFDRLIAQCQALGLLHGKLKIVDATRVVANVAIPNTVNLLREARRRLVAAVAADTGQDRADLRERYATDAFIRALPTKEMLATSTWLSEELLAECAEFTGERSRVAQSLLAKRLAGPTPERSCRRAQGRPPGVRADSPATGHDPAPGGRGHLPVVGRAAEPEQGPRGAE